MKPVLTKRDMVNRYRAGEFGNHSPTWGTLADWWTEDPVPWVRYGRMFHIRNRVAGGLTFYNVDAGILSRYWNDIAKECGGEKNLYISAMSPHEHNLLQGEVWDGPGGLYLHGTYEIGMPMRDALSVSPFDCTGLEARLRLQQVMNDLSWEWFQWLLEAYPDHVIEFSSFNVCWGTVPGHNTVFWEVRKY